MLIFFWLATTQAELAPWRPSIPLAAGCCRLLLLATVCVVLGSAMWEILDWLLRKLNLLRDAHPFAAAGVPAKIESSKATFFICCNSSLVNKFTRPITTNKALHLQGFQSLRRILDSNQWIPYDIGSLANCWFKPLTQPSFSMSNLFGFGVQK